MNTITCSMEKIGYIFNFEGLIDDKGAKVDDIEKQLENVFTSDEKYHKSRAKIEIIEYAIR